MSLYSTLLISVSLLNMLCIITVIFFEKKSPSSTLAWILVLSFLPFIGFIAYAMFGSGFHVNQKKKYAVKAITDRVYKKFVLEYVDVNNGGYAKPEDTDCARMIRYLENDGGYYYTQDNDIDVFVDGNEMIACLKNDILQAGKHIHLLSYIIRNDSVGREIVDLLEEKARSGVEVRVIYDSLGSLLSGERIFKELRKAGGEVEAFSPLLFTLSSHLRLNYRNHRKITVIDGTIGYVGGMNIGKEYLGQHKRLHPWRDTHLRLTGSSVNFLQERFLMDWIYASDRDIQFGNLEKFFSKTEQPRKNLGVQVVSSGPDTKSNAIKNGLLEMLYAARSNVFIQTPYFTLDESIADGLRIAARSGVDVRLMLPGLSDKWLVHSATYGYAWQLLDAGVKVYMYPGFLHAKTMVFDGEAASIGTANLDNRSFALNFEVNAFIYDKSFAAEYERIFLRDQEQCTELSGQWFADRRPLTRAAYGFSRLLAPLM